MALHDITLAATESNWRLFMVRKADPAFLSFQDKVFDRDQHTCQFCGFQADSFQEVVNLDGNYKNNKLSNLVTACVFCTQCCFLEAVGKGDFGGGTLILLPEMSQTELNALCHMLFTSMITGDSFSADAKNFYRTLRLRAQQVEKQLGEGMSNPSLYGHLLIDAKSPEAEILHKELSVQLRLLPKMSSFSEHLQTWVLSSLKNLMV